MFDKNFFKDAFRSWVFQNPHASEEEALAFCQAHIPAREYVTYYWLVEQSMQWLHWLQTQTPSAVEMDDEGCQDTRH